MLKTFFFDGFSIFRKKLYLLEASRFTNLELSYSSIVVAGALFVVVLALLGAMKIECIDATEKPPI